MTVHLDTIEQFKVGCLVDLNVDVVHDHVYLVVVGGDAVYLGVFKVDGLYLLEVLG